MYEPSVLWQSALTAQGKGTSLHSQISRFYGKDMSNEKMYTTLIVLFLRQSRDCIQSLKKIGIRHEDGRGLIEPCPLTRLS